MKAKKCDGQSVYSAAKIEAAVLEVVHRYFKNTARTMDSVWHEQIKLQLRSKSAVLLKLAKAELEKLHQQDARLRQEVMRSLMGESAFEADMLKEMLEGNKADIAEAETRVEDLEAEKDAEASRLKYLSSQYQLIRDWAAEFDDAANDTKKMILARLIEKITADRHFSFSEALDTV